MIGFSGNPFAQRAWEFRQFLNWCQAQEVNSFLEIGSRYGDAFHAVTKTMPKYSKAVAVDLVDGLWGRSDSASYLNTAALDLYKREYDASVIYGDSTSSKVVDLVRDLGPYDLCLIDGDHRLEGATLDWMNYGPMCRYVAFHDIDGMQHFYSKTGDYVDVPYLWTALKKRYKHWEFIDTDHRGMGIGILDTKSPIVRKL